MSLREEDFVTSARLSGSNEIRIIGVHLFPSFTSHLIVTVPEKEASEEIFLFYVNTLNSESTLVVKHNGVDVSSYFRYDQSTGAVYLKAGYSVDFETTQYYNDYWFNQPTYHAGTDLPLSSNSGWLTLYINDGGTLTEVNVFGDTNQFILVPGDTAEDGEIEIVMGMYNGPLSFGFDQAWELPFESYNIIATAGDFFEKPAIEDMSSFLVVFNIAVADRNAPIFDIE